MCSTYNFIMAGIVHLGTAQPSVPMMLKFSGLKVHYVWNKVANILEMLVRDASQRKVHVDNDQEKAQKDRNSHSKKWGGKN